MCKKYCFVSSDKEYDGVRETVPLITGLLELKIVAGEKL